MAMPCIAHCTFLQSKFDGIVPEPQALREADREILAELDAWLLPWLDTTSPIATSKKA